MFGLCCLKTDLACAGKDNDVIYKGIEKKMMFARKMHKVDIR